MITHRSFAQGWWIGVVGLWTGIAAGNAAPLSLHPENPHYFLFRSRPTVLITCGEHYGAVLNLDFDYKRYLRELQRCGFNLTRTFSGAYVEPSGAFRIEKNTLAPRPGRFICPWARSKEPGYAGGGNKFDLDRWDEAYFRRLRDFMRTAAECGVVVEMNLFCPFYSESQWRLSPMNARNNVNGVGHVARTNVYTLDRNGGLLKYQEALVRKIVTEPAPFDNVYYEICNEPYFGGVTLEWQYHIAEVIARTEERLGVRHLISRNVANGHRKIKHPHRLVSIFNFHYAYPPTAVTENYHLNRVIGDNETGFQGTNNAPYRIEGWHFILAGGGLFNHLDYSFTVGHESGDFQYPSTQPGGGNALLRQQIGALHRFMKRLDFISMRPIRDLWANPLPQGFLGHALGRTGRQYAFYISRERKKLIAPEFGAANEKKTVRLQLALQLGPGRYEVRWFDPLRCRWMDSVIVESDGRNAVQVRTPRFLNDIAAVIERVKR